MTFIYNKQSMKERRQTLRNSVPKAESILWSYLKNKRLYGYKFRRQYSVGPYVIDFYCPKLKLAIEIDGPSHIGRGKYDKERQKYIESIGISFLRFINENVYNNLEGVIETICNKLP
ncbi:DUF559 domain-containing protein [Patescibacteria group bacterium]|nr:DUF559 domain-containing protein [Patescibacteria group bacterium]